MAYETFSRRKFSLLTSTALTKQVAALGALGVVFGANSAFALDPNALPQDPNVVGGGATFNSSGATLTVNQSTNRTVIDWRSFDIGSNATTNFVQPGASSIAVNRVNASANPTEIQGSLNANGQVWILNPNGVLFGKTAKIDVAGIVASTANISVQTFMSGDTRLQLTGGDHGSVTNEGAITVADNGLAAFVAPSVRNSGVIQARVGRVTLAAGSTFTLDLAGDQLVEIGLGANNALVDQSGKILADGSRINLSAKSASAVVDSVVNVSGTVLASSVSQDGGAIILSADNVTTTSDAVLKADAGTNGNGGEITSYANKTGNYDGAFSAKGGSQSGDGGFIETSGNAVNFGSSLAVSASASNGAAGKWLIDPSDISIDDASAYVASLQGGTSVEISTADGTGGNGDITLNTNINAAATNGADLTLTGRHISRSASNTVTISGAGSSLIVNVNAVNNTPVGGAWIQDALNIIGTVAGGTTINVGAGTYNANNTINKSDVTLAGADGAKINVAVGQTGVTINGSNVTLQGFEIAGPVVGDQATLDWNAAGNSWGVQVTAATNANVNILDNNIHNVRSGILIANSGNPVSGAASGTIADNIIEDTKGGILVQYRDGTTFDIHGNSQGQYGNEWGIVTGLQLTKIVSDAGLARQAQILAWSEGNNGMTVLDRQYATANRSSVTVDATGTATAADDFNLGNGVGNERQPINNIQQGINAVVAGGTVNVNDGTYTISSGYLSIGKSLNLIGESEAGVIIDAHAASSYGLRVIGGTNGVNLSNFTLYGVVASGGYGIKVEDSQNVNIANVTSKGAYKGQIDLNGLRGGTLDNVTADGAASAWGTGSHAGAAIAITDSQDITVSNSSTSGGSYGGVAIYQSNKPSGYTYQTKDITLADSNTYAEANAVYTEDESATNNFGTLNVAGFNYIARNTNAADTYTWFQKTQQGAIDAAVLASGYVQGWLGSAASNVFTVGYNTARDTALSINTAINAATTGATINVLSGTYNQTVTINKGLTLAGAGIDDTTLTGGIKLNGSFSDLTFRDFTVSGDGGSNAIVRGGSTLTNFTVDHVRFDGGNVAGRYGFASGLYSGAISITDSEFVNIRGWSAFDTSTGGSSSVITSVVFTGNTLDNTVGHVTFRQSSPTANVTISDNVVRNVGDTTDLSSGIFKVFGAATVDFSNNDISGIGASPTKFTAGIADGAALIVRDVTTLNLTDNTFTDNQQALLVGAGNALPTTINITGNTFTNNVNDIQLAGAVGAGTLNFGAGNNFISGAQTQQHLLWGGSSNVDMTDVEFDGKLGSEMTLAELFATEDLITHGLDSATAGLVTVKDGNVYVTTNSGSIQRGIDKVSTGDTVNVDSGVYNEALNINKNVDIVGAGSNETFIRPDALLSTGAAHKYDANVKTTVYVHDADNVNISGVTIDGNNLGNNAIVFWNNASGTISDSAILNAIAFTGVQTGQGLALDASTGHVSNLDLTNVDFSNWNKNAIDAVTSGGDVTLNVINSTFTGHGATGTIAQNGILLWERSGGTIHATVDGSTFSDIDYTGDDTATGILVYGSPNATLSVSNSSFDDVKNYIATSGATGSEIDATVGNIFDGVSLANATRDQIYAIEDKIEDGLDDAASGFVRLVEDNVYVTQQSGNIQGGVFVASAGDTIHVQAGDYDGGVNVNKQGVTLAGDDGVTIHVNPVTGQQLNGININANNVTVDGFEIVGEITGSYLTYLFDNTISRGVAVSNGVTNFTITNNVIQNVRNGILIDGRNTGSITNNLIDNTKGAVSIQYTDAGVGNTEGYSVAMTGNSEGSNGNEWGVNVHLNGHQDGVGGLTSAKIAADATSTVQQALLANSAANGGWSVQDQGYSYSNRTVVYVDTNGSASNQGSQRGALNSINDGVKAVVTGGTVHVNDGTYVIASGGGNYLHITKALSLIGQSEAGTIIDASAASTYGIRVQADDVSLSDFTLKGPAGTGGYGIKVEPLADAIIDPNARLSDFSIANVTIKDSYKTGLDLNGVNGATIDSLTVTGATHGNGVALTDTANATLTNVSTSGNAWGGLALYQTNRTYNQQTSNISVDTTNSFGEANGVYLEDESASLDFGSLTVEGYNYAAHNTNVSDAYTWLQTTVAGAADALQAGGVLASGYVNGWTGSTSGGALHVGHTTGGDAMSINAAVANSVAGDTINVGSGIYGEDVVVTGARNIAFNGSTVNSYTQNVASAIGGAANAINGFVLNAATTLLSNTTLNGAVTAQSIDGSTAGGQSLTINGGSNAVALGNLGATTRLGATNVTGTTSLNGNTYKANALTFNGPSTLTRLLTTFDTSDAGGNVTFTGNLFGTTDNLQSVAFTTGNGDISLQNAGTDSVWLGSMVVAGDDFSAGSVYVNGYVSVLTGNQTFTSTTLNSKGGVNSLVGGNASGPIKSDSDVNIVTGGDFHGNITAPSGSVTGGNITGIFTGNTFTFVASRSVDVTANVTTINLTTPSGKVDGTFSHINTGGGPVIVNGKTRSGNTESNPNQIVVEGYTLPAGAIVTPSGEIVLPNGMVIGLISPQAGGGAPGSKPKVVIVHSVQKLGELLAQGYVAIIVDLSKNNDEQEELALAD